MRRIAIVGNSGSGKSTLARAVAVRLGLPHVELDALYHQPGWTQLPEAEFRAEVDALTAADGWVVDGNYSVVRDLVWGRADTLVWLDLPRRTVMRRIVARTLTRAVTRRELWNGNRERPLDLLSRDPERSIIRWSWTQHDRYRRTYRQLTASPEWSHLEVVRLRTPQEVRRWLATPGG